MTTCVDVSQHSYERDGVSVIKALADVTTRRRILDWMVRNVFLGNAICCDGQVTKAYAFPRPPFERTLLDQFMPEISNRSGCSLTPSYVYGRIYLYGSSLEKHVDREGCQLTATVALGGANGSCYWPIFVQGRHGTTYEISLTAGDALLLDGMHLPHWREKLTNDWQAQIFLHYWRFQGGHNGPS